MKEWQKPVLTVLGTEETKGGGNSHVGDGTWIDNTDYGSIELGSQS